ncbi:TetR/AcrR family transcriptional regulator [Vibrio hannami]|uniref:TetR/AcrR family transcriptional regulator n=1 Tax=Vibrio hannami TaxID=2717094 RepID=UPI002410175F|nr:TetR/AcrR family transcriptional regulator [Vibrio hannami]MDG3085880.1 TetR/AcrR family transcriptional regulator [Vibrio hannami]
MLKNQISASLELAFSEYGFAEPSVAKLKDASDVSLRTLYRYFPSKEAMVVGALEYRHERYLRLISDNALPIGEAAILHVFSLLEEWMERDAPNGCMSTQAMSAFPGNPLIKTAVKNHKLEVKAMLGRLSGREELAGEIFLLHEGVSATWPILGKEAISIAKVSLIKLFNGSNQ